MDDMLRELYQEVILDHGKNPRNFRHPEDATCEADGNNPLCGDRLTVYAKVGEDQMIEDAAAHGLPPRFKMDRRKYQPFGMRSATLGFLSDERAEASPDSPAESRASS